MSARTLQLFAVVRAVRAHTAASSATTLPRHCRRANFAPREVLVAGFAELRADGNGGLDAWPPAAALVRTLGYVVGELHAGGAAARADDANA